MRITISTDESKQSGDFIDAKSATLILSSVKDAQNIIKALNEFIERFDRFSNGGHVHVYPCANETYARADLVLIKGSALKPKKTPKCKHVRWVASDTSDSPSAKCAECGFKKWEWFCPSPDSPKGLCNYSGINGDDECIYCGDPDERK